MDIFCEYMVKHKKTMKDNLIAVGLVCLALLLSLILIFVMLTVKTGLGGILLLLLVGVWYGAVYLIRRRNLEFEYILTNGVLDIDKIMARSARKRVISINFKDIDVCAPAKDENFRHKLENKDSGAKILDLSGNIEDDNVYFVELVKEGQLFRVFSQPNANILNGIKHANPRQVTVREADLA